MQTIFILTGIAIGVAVIVFMSSLLTGMQSNFVNRVLTGQAHIQLLNPKERVVSLREGPSAAHVMSILQVPLQRFKSIDQWQPLTAQLTAMPEIKVASPSVTGSVLLMRGEASRSVSVTGVLPELYF